MANQENFGSPIENLVGERPYRPSTVDQNLTIVREKTVLFGTNPSDNIELWFYFADGTFAATVRLSAEDSSIKLSTTIDNTGAYEYINLDLEKITKYAQLDSGRYTMSVYFLRDEVGTREGNRLLIKDISPSRTEVKLSPVTPDDDMSKDIYEFIVPSVPRLYAKGLIDQVFNKSLNESLGEFISDDEISNQLKNIGNSIERIGNINAEASYLNIIEAIVNRTYQYSIEALEADSKNFNVQSVELQKYIIDALNKSIDEMIVSKEMDSRFLIV